MPQKRERILKSLCIADLLLMALTLAFIWGNSLLCRAQSGSISGAVSAWLAPFLNFAHLDADTFEALVRKLAHFTEFAIFGAEFLAFNQLLKRRDPFLPAFGTLLAAALDEFWQVFRDRGPRVQDVLLDFSGAVFGMLCMALLIRICRKIRERRANKAALQ